MSDLRLCLDFSLGLGRAHHRRAPELEPRRSGSKPYAAGRSSRYGGMGVPGSQDCFAGVAPPACDATARTVRVTWQHSRAQRQGLPQRQLACHAARRAVRALWPAGPGKVSYPERLHISPITLETWLVHWYQFRPLLAMPAWLLRTRSAHTALQQDSVLELPSCQRWTLSTLPQREALVVKLCTTWPAV